MSFSLQVAATAASGTSATMASCPDSDNSWVLAGSEVGKTGLGTTWKGGSCRAGLLSGSVPFLGPHHLHHPLLAVRGTLEAEGDQALGVRCWDLDHVLTERSHWGKLRKVGEKFWWGYQH